MYFPPRSTLAQLEEEAKREAKHQGEALPFYDIFRGKWKVDGGMFKVQLFIKFS